MTFTLPLHPMRAALLGLLTAPVALLSTGVESKAYPAMHYSEPLECAVVGNDRVIRAALGCPAIVPVSQPIFVGVQSESVECAIVGSNRMMRAALGCPRY